MSSHSNILDYYLSSRDNFYNSYDEKLEFSSSNNSTFAPKDLKWEESLIPKLEQYFNAHYLCPKCFQFPLIDFISRDYIYYICFCKDRKKKLVKIKELFNKDSQYLTFGNNYLEINSSPNSKDNEKGFKCTEKHNSDKYRKFRYYCTQCKKNLCSKCVTEHMAENIENDKDKSHDLIVFDYQKKYNYKKIEFVNNKINEEKEKKIKDNSNIGIQVKEKVKIIETENGVITIKEEIGDGFNYFIEFVNIIFTDYFKFPNYYHTYNIENIFRFFQNEKNFGMKIKYINQPNKYIRLFGRQFVNNNKDKLSIIIDDSIEYIKDSHQFNPDKKSVEIYLTNKNNDYNNNYNNSFNLSHLFEKCDSLYEIEFDIKDYKFEEDLSYLFDGCKSLQEIPDCISDWINLKYIKINSGHIDISYMFHDCSCLKKLPDISKWNLSFVSNMEGLFEGCKHLISLPDISNWDTRDVSNMSYMFSRLNLKNIPDISKWNTKCLDNLSHMFSDCPELTSIPDLSKWNTNNIEDISGMFENCSSLQNLDFLSQWKFTKLKCMNNLFDGCNKLKKSDISKWKIKGIVNELKSINDSDQTTLNINNEILLKDFNMKYNLKIKDSKINKINIGNMKLRDELLINLCKIEFNELKELYLGFNKIADIKILEKAKFDKLEILNLSHNQIKNINVLEKVNFKELRELYLNYNYISDINIFEKVKFPKLRILNLGENEISDISILENVKFGELKELLLYDNKIIDIKVLEKFEFNKLERLILKCNKISDINILEKVNFKELNELNLSKNKISDIKVFERVNFRKLIILDLRDNKKLTKENEFISKLKNKIVYLCI